MLVHTQILLYYIIYTRVLGSFGWRVCVFDPPWHFDYLAQDLRARKTSPTRRSTVAHRCLHKRSSYNNYYNGRFRLIFRPEMLYILIRYIVIDSFFYDAQNAYLRVTVKKFRPENVWLFSSHYNIIMKASGILYDVKVISYTYKSRPTTPTPILPIYINWFI